LPMASSWLEEVRLRAKAALTRPAPYEPDVDVTQFGDGRAPLEEGAVAAAAERAGVSMAAAAYYIQADNACQISKQVSRRGGLPC